MNRVCWFMVVSSLIFGTAACTPAAASVRTDVPDPLRYTLTRDDISTPVIDQEKTTSPSPPQTEDEVSASATPGVPISETTEKGAVSTITPTDIASVATPALTPTPCEADVCSYAVPYFLSRPIAKPGNLRVDNTYRFGSTQGEMREPHHGVELLNSFGTPVMAAADGVVVVAGDDRDPTSPRGIWPITYYGPYAYFYGNLVVIEHQPSLALIAAFPDLPRPIYSLYAHLSNVSVEPGQKVTAGQQIGAVGLSGIAEGSHLHFEVRLGENTYESVRNPELWLAPFKDEDGRRMGGIAGRVVDEEGNPLVVSGGIVLQRLPDGPESPHDLEMYVMAYEEPALIGLPPFEESFAIGDLPPGLYRITFASRGVQQFLVDVLPGQLSVATLRVK